MDMMKVGIEYDNEALSLQIEKKQRIKQYKASLFIYVLAEKSRLLLFSCSISLALFH